MIEELIEKAFCEGYEYAQKEFNSKEMKALRRKLDLEEGKRLAEEMIETVDNADEIGENAIENYNSKSKNTPMEDKLLQIARKKRKEEAKELESNYKYLIKPTDTDRERAKALRSFLGRNSRSEKVDANIIRRHLGELADFHETGRPPFLEKVGLPVVGPDREGNIRLLRHTLQ